MANEPWLRETELPPEHERHCAEKKIKELLAEAAPAAEAPAGEPRAADRPAPIERERQYQMALDDLLAVKAKNAKLQQQLAKAQTVAAKLAKCGAPSGRSFDWESEKRRILAALESDFDPSDAAARAERLKIEDVVRSTEIALEDKDHEIEHWKKRCEELACDAGDGPDSAENACVLDADAVVQQERQRLRQLQDELQEKLRLAEIDLSVERAKLARQRAELEEQSRSAEGQSEANPPAAGDCAQRSPRGRWLAQLGLTEADRERGRPR
jgi:hypothetical protein